MKLRWLPLLVLVCISLGGLAVFATDPLLYAVEKDQSVSVFHKNPVLLRQLASNSTTDLMPLMQDLIDDQEPLVFDIRLRDIDAAEEDLIEYTFRRGSLKVTVENLDLNDAEIQAFLSGIQDQEDILSALAANTSAFESLRKIAERNRDDLDVQVSVASQAALLKESVRTLDSRYSSDHRDVMNISTKLGRHPPL
jgi:hypothetical protein